MHMYERFTDRARKVMQLATMEALRFNHEYVGTDHVLIGLTKEGIGVAASVLKDLGVNLEKIREEITKISSPGTTFDVVPVKMPHTPRAKKIIEYAIGEARELNHSYVGTEHLLLGLLHEPESLACQVLTHLGLKLETVREAVLRQLKQKDDEQAQGIIVDGDEDQTNEEAPRPTVYKAYHINLSSEEYDCDRYLEEKLRVRFNLSEDVRITGVIVMAEIN